MSETSQGPGWWLASDGKWYPPQVWPPPAPPSNVQAPPSTEPTSSRNTWLIVLAVAVGVIAVVVVVIAVVVMGSSSSPNSTSSIESQLLVSTKKVSICQGPNGPGNSGSVCSPPAASFVTCPNVTTWTPGSQFACGAYDKSGNQIGTWTVNELPGNQWHATFSQMG